MVAKSPAVVGSFGTKLSVSNTKQFGRKSQNKKISVKEHKFFDRDSSEFSAQEKLNAKSK
jgi:hypothetical protein